jgi:hypothetical protein
MYDTSRQPEQMRARYHELPEEIQELFEYGTVETVLDNVAVEFGLSDEQKALLQMETELVLFLLEPRMGFIERTKESLEIDATLAELLVARLESDLFIIVDRLLIEAEKQLTQPVSQTPPADVSPIVLPPLSTATENPTNQAEQLAPSTTQVQPLRTFAMDVDMNRAHGYGAFRSEDADSEGDAPVHRSSQDDIIKK